MKKPVRMVVGMAGVAAALVAAFAVDTYVRARRAFAAHERRVEEDFAALRQRHASAPHPAEGRESKYEKWLDSLELRSVPKESTNCLSLSGLRTSEILGARRLAQSGTYFEYEIDPTTVRYPLPSWDPEFGSRWDPRPEPSSEDVLRLLAVAQDSFRAGGVNQARQRLYIEAQAIECWKEVIEWHDLTPSQLAEFAVFLDRIQRARPPVQDALDAEYAMARQEVVRVIRKRRNPGVVSEPGWRQLFSWHILLVQVMNEMDRDRRELAKFDALPETEQERRIYLAQERPWKARRFIEDGYNLFALEAEARARWALMRTATAVAWYEAENGRSPERLDQLVPRYLGAVPKGITHQSGFLYLEPLSPETQIWFVHRRGVPAR